MLTLALDGAELLRGSDQEPINGDALGTLARKYLVAEAVIGRLEKIIDPDAMRAVLEGVVIKLEDETSAKLSAARLQEQISRLAALRKEDAPSVVARYNDQSERWQLQVLRTHHGNVKVS